MKYTYNQEAPNVSPVAPYEYDGNENVVFDGETDKDVVTLEIIQLGGNRVAPGKSGAINAVSKRIVRALP